MSDIYTIEKQVDEMIEFMKDRASADIKLYSNSRIRYQRLLEKFNIISDIISTNILDGLMFDDHEPVDEGQKSNFNTDDLSNMMDKMDELFKRYETAKAELNSSKSATDSYEQLLETSDDELDKAESTISISKNKEPQDSNIITGTNITLDDLEAADEFVSADSGKDISKKAKSNVMTEYENAILALTRDRYVRSADLSDVGIVMVDWFQTRYGRRYGKSSGSRDPTFLYKIDSIPKWILGFVISYTDYQNRGRLEEFHDEVNNWLDQIDGKDSPKYPVPKIIAAAVNQEFYDAEEASRYIDNWQILYDGGLKKLEKCIYPLHRYTMIQHMLKNGIKKAELSKLSLPIMFKAESEVMA